MIQAQDNQEQLDQVKVCSQCGSEDVVERTFPDFTEDDFLLAWVCRNEDCGYIEF